MYKIENLEGQKYRLYKRPGETMWETFVAFLLRLPAESIAMFLDDKQQKERFAGREYVDMQVPEENETLEMDVIYLQQSRTRYVVSPQGDCYVPMESVMREVAFYNAWEMTEEETKSTCQYVADARFESNMVFYYTMFRGRETVTRRFDAECHKCGENNIVSIRVTDPGEATFLQDALELEREKTEIISSLFDDWIYEYNIEDKKITTIRGTGRQYNLSEENLVAPEYLSAEDIHPEDKTAFAQFCHLATDSTEPGYEEVRIRINNEYRWISLTTKLLSDKQGKPYSVIGRLSDINDKKIEELELKEKAMRDSMTGLLNRSAFQEKAELLIDRMLENGAGNPVLMIIDIDHFKQINDRYGHLFGDTVIMTLTRVMNAVFGKESVLGRFGGDEFTVLLPKYDKAVLESQIAMLRERFTKEAAQSEENRIHCSIGLSVFGQDGTSVDELVRNADNALYYVKENGRNNYAFCDETMKLRFTEEYRIKHMEQPIPDNKRVAEDITEYALELLEGTSELKTAVNVLLSKTGRRFNLACVSIREYDRERPRISYLWKDENRFQINRAQNVFLSKDEWKEISEKYRGNQIIEFSDVSELPKESAQYRVYQANEIVALLQCPLISEGKAFGYISYVDTEKREWTEEERHPLIMLSRLIGNYLAREKAYQRIQQKIELMKSFDEVTGLLKFDKFKEVAQAVLDQGNRNVQYGLVSVDFSHFKYFNEIYGFRSGDEVLKDFAEAVAKHNPRSVAACRDYADNFIIMVMVQSPAAFRHNIETYNQAFVANQNQKFPDSKLELCCGAYVITDPEGGIVQAIDNANLARKELKEKKEAGVLFFEPSMKVNRIREIALQHMVEEAISSGEFRMYLQPKISMETGELVGAEALARWEKPDGTMIMPGEFIPALEKSGKIVELDFFMYETMLKQMRSWLNKEYPMVPISVNLSRHHFKNENLIEHLLELKERYQIDADMIEIEITEGAFFADQGKLVRMIEAMKEKGFLVSIDDFGTGYSSLAMLTELSVDIVKLDKGFLREKDTDVTRTMLANVIRLIKDNKKSIVCEGVETKEQAEFLAKAGCDTGQGYYFAKPMPAAQFAEKYFNSEKG